MKSAAKIFVLTLVLAIVSWIIFWVSKVWQPRLPADVALWATVISAVVSFISGIIALYEWAMRAGAERRKRKPVSMVAAGDMPYVERKGEYDAIAKSLLKKPSRPSERKSGTLVVITAALRGAGGYGKTTLAQAVCRDKRVIKKFKDGILWVTLGENPSPQELIHQIEHLVVRLEGACENLPGLDAAAARLHAALKERTCLLVIDDVWDRAHLSRFLQAGPRGAYLITTRNDDTLPPGTSKITVDAMRWPEAVELLGVGLPTGSRAGLGDLAAQLENWPLLLSLANAHLRMECEHFPLETAVQRVSAQYARRGLAAFDPDNPFERRQAAG